MPRKPRVLVVDDEPVIADTLAIILNHDGFEARAVYCGEDALQIAPAFAPEMLICDVMMTALNGIETAIMARALLPQIKILLFSGHAGSAELLRRAREQGHNFEVLAKPAYPKDVLTRLRGNTSQDAEVSGGSEIVFPMSVPSPELEQHCN